MGMDMIRTAFFLRLLPSVLLALLASSSARAEVVANLYRGEAIVTGQDNLPERERGIREALIGALVKASGDAAVASDPRLPALLAHASDAVQALDYEDRLAKKKLMDEQGTRERSFLLRVDFRPEDVDRMLAQLGLRPWPADRPKLLVLLSIHDLVGTYVLASDSARGSGQREALADSARRLGVPVVLPSEEMLSESGATASAPQGDVAGGPADATEQLRLTTSADGVLTGVMVITPEGVWGTQWRLATGNRERSLTVPASSFDRSMREALSFAAAQLSAQPR